MRVLSPACASRRGAILVLLLCSLAAWPFVTGFGPVGLLESSGSDALVQAHQVQMARRFTSPVIEAPGAVVLDERTGQVLYGRNEHRRLPMASTTKIMTALVAIERGRLDQTVNTSVSASDMPGSSVMGLKPGERLSLRDLLYGLLLPSGNDAAVAIARAIGGSETGFVDLMNRRAVEMGLVDTHFANSHGLDDPSHYSSPLDLATLASRALAVPEFAKIVATREWSVQGVVGRYDLKNTNRLLARPDVEGVKTGTTDLAGSCLVSAFRRGADRVIVVVLNSPDAPRESIALADYAFSQFAWLHPSLPVSPIDKQGASEKALVAISDSVRLPVPVWEVSSLRVTSTGQAARVTFGSSTLATLNLSAPSEVTR